MEFRGALNLSKFDPLPEGCEAVTESSGIRFLPMDFAVEKCFNPDPFDVAKDNGIVVALHANCAVGIKGTLPQRVFSKAKWLRDSGMWFGKPLVGPKLGRKN